MNIDPCADYYDAVSQLKAKVKLAPCLLSSLTLLFCDAYERGFLDLASTYFISIQQHGQKGLMDD